MLIKKWLYVGMLLLASMATAAPFARTFTFTQPNGTIIELWGEGDEFSAHFTHDGLPWCLMMCVKPIFMPS